MANSFIDPELVRMSLPEGPGWEWNPGQTFVTAFNNAQENRRRNEEAAMEQELSSILFPAKKAQAEFTIKQLAYESKLLENSYRTQSAELDERYRLIKSGGADVNNTGSSGTGYKSRFGFGSKLNAAPTQTATQPSVRKVGSGLMPKTP